MGGLSLVNLLAFVQVAVVFNFGLFFLRRQNTYSDVKKEFLNYLKAYKDGYSENAKNAIENRIENESSEISIEREYVNKYYGRLEFLTKEEDHDYLVLPCVGLFSGIYSLLFLLIIGIDGWYYEDKTYNMLLLISQIVLIMNFVSYFKLHDNDDEMTVRRDILKLVMSFLILCLAAFLLSCFDYVIPVIDYPDSFLAVSSIAVVYFPALLLVYTTMKTICTFSYNQLMCNYHVWKIKKLVENNATVENEEP